MSLVLQLGAVQLLVSAALLAVRLGTPLDEDLAGIVLSLCVVVALGGVGVLLVVGERGDEQGAALGGVLLLSGVPFANYWTLGEGARPGPELSLLMDAPSFAFLPFATSCFAAVFPRAVDRRGTARTLVWTQRVLLWSGVLLFSASALRSVLPDTAVEGLLWQGEGRLFEQFLVAGVAVSMLLVGYRLRRAPSREVRQAHRMRWLMLLLVAIVLVAALAIVIDPMVQPAGEDRPDGSGLLIASVRTLFWALVVLFVPTLIVAVVGRRAVQVRLLAARLAIRFMAYAAGTSSAVLLVFALVDRVGTGEWPIATASTSALIVMVAAVGVSVLFDRGRALRDGQGADGLLSLRPAREAANERQLVEWLAASAEALGLESIDLLPSERPLAGTAPLAGVPVKRPSATKFASLFAVGERGINLEAGEAVEEVATLSAGTRAWLRELSVAALLPAYSVKGELIAVLAVGRRVDQKVLSAELMDRLELLSSALGLAFERLAGPGAGGADAASRTPADMERLQARRCVECDRVFSELVAECTDCGLATDSVEEPLIIAGKYQIERCLGAGSLGRVFLARDLLLERSVALKCLDSAAGGGFRSLLREARAMAVLEHRHLATVYGVEVMDDRLFVATELFRRGTVATLLDAGPLSGSHLLRMGRELLDAVCTLHEKDMVHGDIKPSNLGVREDGSVALLDFGFVRLLDDTSRVGSPEPQSYRASTVLPGGHPGTPLYAPPEAWAAASVGDAADLWPLAVVLWELASGSHPFERTVPGDAAASARATSEAILNARLPDADHRLWPPGLRAVLGQALAVDPSERFVDAHDFKKAFGAIR